MIGGSGWLASGPPIYSKTRLLEKTHMKMIVAIIRPEKLEAVQDALDAKQIYLMTASDVRGCGSQRGYSESYRGNKGVIRLLSKVKLEIAVNEDYVKPADRGDSQGRPVRVRAASATEKSSSFRLKNATAFAPARKAPGDRAIGTWALPKQIPHVLTLPARIDLSRISPSRRLNLRPSGLSRF